MRNHQGLGSYAWSERTNGVLSSRDVMSLFLKLASVQAGEVADALLSWTPGFRRRLRRVNFGGVTIPDSKIAMDTIDYARSQYGSPLLLHCYRTYAFGVMFAQAGGMKFDPELLFVSSLLHDLGLVAEGGACKSHCCFAVDGARRTKSWVERYGWDEGRALRAYEAVSYHLNPAVSAKRNGVEAHLLASGAALDVIGARRKRLPLSEIRHAHKDYPRDGFIAGIVETMTEPHAERTRADLLIKGGFRRMTAGNPLETDRYGVFRGR